jgi:hypothetical protein
MKAQIFSHEQLIGTTELLIGDEHMGHIFGKFSPTEYYYMHVQKSAWEFQSSKKPDYNKWHSLNFNAQLENDCFVFASGGFTFDDSKEFPEDTIQINIAGIDSYIIEDFFKPEEPRPFVIKPWESITIRQKITFEEELRKELGIKNTGKSFFNFFRDNYNDHILSDFETAALCKFGGNDYVLFRIEKQGLTHKFAVVHLTWRGAKEDKDYPRVQFYESFDDFKYSRMYPDKADWEY